ncbi:MAG: hypothetical protein ACTHNS_12085 [Marmoricola sp.]
MSTERVSFTLARRSFDLTADDVRRRLQQHYPEAVDQYWVDIDGVRWPVKQVMALATGLARTSFQSQNSRRLLAKLGFAVGTGSKAVQPGTRRPAASRSGSVKVADLPHLETLTVTVALTWRQAGSIVLDGQGLPLFPRLPSEPGLYRYDFGLDEGGTHTYYIGESQNLARRARNYRNAKTDRSTQRTSRRIHMEITRHLMSGGSIDFAIATEVAVDGSGPADLRLKSARRLAENAAVLIAQQTPRVRVLNIDSDLGTRGDEE